MIQLLEKVEEPKIFFTAQAWLKMTAMVDNVEAQECALEGTVTKDGDMYIINDVFSYPQLITSVTVTTDDDKYNQWLMELPDDVINTKRFQMHSHVNMATNPSQTDLDTYDKLLAPVDDFMIFMILNRKHEYNLYLYDLINNLVYDKASLEVGILLDENTSTYDWYTEKVKPMLGKKATVITKPTTKNYGGTYGYSFDYNKYLESN